MNSLMQRHLASFLNPEKDQKQYRHPTSLTNLMRIEQTPTDCIIRRGLNVDRGCIFYS